VPENYPNVRFIPSQRARDALIEQNLTIQDAIYVVQSCNVSWPGHKPSQRWHRGTTLLGIDITVLTEDIGAGQILIITVRDVQGGG
jgi:hypothetical protein